MKIRLALLSLVLSSPLAQSQPDLAGILNKISEVYTSVSQYELIWEEFENGAISKSTYMLFAFQGPNRYRLDGGIPGVGSEGLTVHDGSHLWSYTSEENTYLSFPAAALTADAPGYLGYMRPATMDSVVMGRYRGAKTFIEGTKFLRRQKIDFGGKKVNCFVLSILSKKEAVDLTWWVDAKRFLVLREDSRDDISVRYTTIKLNEPLPEGLFQFKPPPGACKVDPH